MSKYNDRSEMPPPLVAAADAMLFYVDVDVGGWGSRLLLRVRAIELEKVIAQQVECECVNK